jgi:hypothetical protein
MRRALVLTVLITVGGLSMAAYQGAPAKRVRIYRTFATISTSSPAATRTRLVGDGPRGPEGTSRCS